MRYLIPLWLMLVCGCGPERLSPREFALYCREQESGLVQAKDLAPFRFEARFEPNELVALRQAIKVGLSKGSHDSILADLSRFLHFEMTVRPMQREPMDEIWAKAIGSKDSLEASKQRFFLGMQDKFRVKMGDRDVPSTFYHVQPLGRLDNAYHALVVFEIDAPIAMPWPGDVGFAFEDEIWTRETIQMTFKKEDLNNLPKLKL